MPPIWPAAVSAAKVYSGCPPYVACTVPSDLVIVPNPFGSEVPDAATGLPITGGQKVAHEPEQLDIVGVSIANQ